MDRVKLLEAYARLVAMRDHLPSRIKPSLADEFHDILELLEAEEGVNLKAFRIPADAIHAPQVLHLAEEFSGTPYTSVIDAYCDNEMFNMRLDGVLRLFELLQSSRASGKAPIGFRPPPTEAD